ncbi:e3 ubiquitin ligase RAD18 [Fusarium subglutinans]|uniref:Postreplication repair E3 ubiquitin-protein ligase RAD18 n=1 Tax=Gibberella subglutinans TaxID=42677 RepID=A0A8H5LD99_GIBSU|nr:e3 ubiquitin ligase RAD18 [Fusarium subglutinans]KAF5589558.1 e3 ubiquitin ligase RAD18 [Fusarium subglutinans]
MVDYRRRDSIDKIAVPNIKDPCLQAPVRTVAPPMANHDVPDSTDWLTTPLTALAVVESALRCQICKDFYKTPMITTCCHTFCSLCIRRALSNEGKCPLCRASEQELKLRSNWAMEEAVQAFINARPTTLDLARNANTKTSSKRKAVQDHHELGDTPDGKRLRSSTRLRNTRSHPSYTVPAEEDETVQVSEGDEDFQPEPEDGLVACPVCESRMKEWQVFKHLETCTGPVQRPRGNPGSSSNTSVSQQRHQTKAPDRLPAINYSMFKDQALRKKMADLGISNQGPRILLERRHKEWMTIWNSNCDAARPRKRHELLHDLDVWERTQGGRAPTTGRSIQNAAIIKDKDFDGAAWAAKHDSSFKDLIANAKRTRLEAKKKAEDVANESKMDGITTPQESSDRLQDNSADWRTVSRSSAFPSRPAEGIPGRTSHSDSSSPESSRSQSKDHRGSTRDSSRHPSDTRRDRLSQD